jgi:hypothetical protein
MSAPRGVAVILVSLLVSAASLSITVRPGYAVAPVPWPASTGLLLAEVQTGGASASDEFVEVYNAGAVEIDLGGCELIYTSATGATTSRKAAFASPLLLVPGAHLLVANSAGIYGSSADATYTGGLASDGGSLALRYVAGAVIDAVGWGTATNSYVEGLVAPAPPARSSLERRPGGIDGNWADSNDNTSDWAVQPNPVPQSLISSPVPAPTSSPAPTSTATRTSEPTATPSPEPTVSPFPTDSAAPTVSPPPTLEPTPSKCPSPTATPSATPTISPSPTISPVPTPTLTPTPGASPTPTAKPSATPTISPSPTVSPEPTPTPVPTVSPEPTPTPVPTASASPTPVPTVSPEPTDPGVDLESIATARSGSVGTAVHVAGLVTTSSGVVGADDLFAIADSSGGIFVRLAAPLEGVEIGRAIDIVGVLAAPYGQIEVREIESLTLGAPDGTVTPIATALSDIGEGLEGSLVSVAGTVNSVTSDNGRLTITVADGETELRVLADPPSGIVKADVVRGEHVALTGIVGQHASALGREDGYRLWLRMRTDLSTIVPTPSPTVSLSRDR